MGCHFLLQGIFPTQGSKPCLLHLLLWHADSLPLMPHGKPLFIPYKDTILNISFLVERGSKRQECLGFIRDHLALLPEFHTQIAQGYLQSLHTFLSFPLRAGCTTGVSTPKHTHDLGATFYRICGWSLGVRKFCMVKQ